jgi:hypothetical protein
VILGYGRKTFLSIQSRYLHAILGYGRKTFLSIQSRYLDAILDHHPHRVGIVVFAHVI